MSSTKPKPNFRIIENDYSYEQKYDSFEKDYMNGMTRKELLDKYDISVGVWKQWIERVPKKRPSQNLRNFNKNRIKQIKHYGDHSMFRRNYKGNISVIRVHNGRRLSYGTYPNMELAEMVRDRLDECNWDKYVAYELLQEHGVKNSKKILTSRLLRRDI